MLSTARNPATWLAGLVLSSSSLAYASVIPRNNNQHASHQLTARAAASDASDLCAAHDWEPYVPSNKTARPRKIYDMLMINTELDWLEIRLNTSYEHVDHFVIVEAPFTFTGKPKDLILKNNLARLPLINKYADKIILHEVHFPSDLPLKDNAWAVEAFQRNAMLDQVFPALAGTSAAPQADDVIIVSDTDELLRPETYDTLRACAFPRRLTLWSDFYYHSFQWRRGSWHHPQATFYSGSVNTTVPPENLRMSSPVVDDQAGWDAKDAESGDMGGAGWSCTSSFKTMAEMLRKMDSFSHQELNQPEHRNPEQLAYRIRNGIDAWNRPGEILTRVDNNTDVPSYILEHPQRFRYLLDRDGPTAGFSDYP